jgi:mono/diheme cytochrome c family protein
MMQKPTIAVGLLVIAAWAVLQAADIPADAGRGAKLVQEKCSTCHSIQGKGGKLAPDLGGNRDRNYTPSYLVVLMWNHAPRMWAAMKQQKIAGPILSEEQLSDIFAYFHSIRFFERLGDAARGKAVFESSKCAECHGISAPIPGGGPPVANWRSLASPIVLAQQMWNHAAKMQGAMQAKHIKWSALTSQQLTDLLVYLRNLNETRGQTTEFVLSNSGKGKVLLESKGCLKCHTGRMSLEQRLPNGTVTDFAVSMWNHAPQMWEYSRQKGVSPPQLEQEEMREIVSYLWYTRLYAESGNPRRGKDVFVKKNCVICHNDPSSGAPDLKKVLGERENPLTPITMATELYQHGPKMLDLMEKRGLPWVEFSSNRELLDLIAYLNGPEIRGTQPK